jgi:CubicO group peptidase (beta-lactamase class C family)
VLNAQPPRVPDAVESDPVRMGWMQDSPPPADKVIRWADGSMMQFPQMRWSFANMRQLVPTSEVWRGDMAASALPYVQHSDLDSVAFQPSLQPAAMTWLESLHATYTDSIVVLHRGHVAYERYSGVMGPHRHHLAMSVTKSLFGTLGAILVDEGRLDPAARVPRYVPELKATAYGDATVRQVLDMTVGVKYSEDYADPDAEIWAHTTAGGVLPPPPDYRGPRTYYEFLQTLCKEGEHGKAFAYKTVNTDVLGWLIRRATGQSVSDVLSTRIWQKLGVERDGYMLVDPVGNEFAGGGFNGTTRDLARFGEMMRLDGRANGTQVVPRAVVDDIRRGASSQQFALGFPGSKSMQGWSYRNQWWITHDDHGAYAAIGIHGQMIYIDPKAEMVIARFASYPEATADALDDATLPAFRAMATHLISG